MHVAVAGTYCSGKTTLVSDLANHFTLTATVADECRPILDVFGRVDWTSHELRTYLFVRQILVERFAGSHSDLTFIDGGVINNLAHDRILMTTPPARGESLGSLATHRYDLVLVTDPTDVAIADDGQRYTDPVMRTALHEMVLEVARDLGYRPTLVSGTREQRIATAKRAMVDGR